MTTDRFEERMATITGSTIGYEDHGIFTASVTLDYGAQGGVQAAGGYDLRHADSAYKFIEGILKVLGVNNWDQVVGKHVVALIDKDGYPYVRGLKALPVYDREPFVFEDMYAETPLGRSETARNATE